MKTFIALFRGINVGGSHIVPMKELVLLLEALGCEGVKTYIQSGNAVFRHDDDASNLASKISSAILDDYGFEPMVLLLTAKQMEKAAGSNPFPEGEADPSKLLLYFLDRRPKKHGEQAIERVRAASEQFAVVGDVAYLYAPEGIARSKLATRVDRILGVTGTGRNWRTVGKILEMARAIRD